MVWHWFDIILVVFWYCFYSVLALVLQVLVVFCHRFSCVLEAPCWQRFVIMLVVFSIDLASFWYCLLYTSDAADE